MSILNKIQNLNWNKRNVNQITQIVVHHSAYRQDNQNNQSRFESLRQFHLNNGWYGLSYHYVIFKDGEIWQCNKLTDASPTDGINYPSLAILVDGYFHDNKDKPNLDQLRSLDYLLGDLCNNHPEFPAVRADVKAHREVNNTVCCGDDLVNYIIEWRDTGKFAILDGVPEEPKPAPISVPVANSINKEYGVKLLEEMKNKGIVTQSQLDNWLRPRLDINGAQASIDTIIELFNGLKASEASLIIKLNNANNTAVTEDLNTQITLLQDNLNTSEDQILLLNQELINSQKELSDLKATKSNFKFDWRKQYETFIRSGGWKILIGALLPFLNTFSFKYFGTNISEQQVLNVLSIVILYLGGLDSSVFLGKKVAEKLNPVQPVLVIK